MRVAVLFRRPLDGPSTTINVRKDICGVFTAFRESEYIYANRPGDGHWYHAMYFDLDAGLPGTGVAEAPENAPSREDGAAPVSPDRPERPERATPPWHASHQRT